MAGNNAIQILRGSRANIINKNQQYKLEEGQLLYNKDDNYLTIGESSNSDLTSPPIVTREIVGYTHENSGDPISTAPAVEDSLKKYSIAYESGSGLKFHNPVVASNGNTYQSSTMNGIQAFAIGQECNAIGNQSFAGGIGTEAVGLASFAFGQGCQAKGDHSFIVGKYNSFITDDIFQVGAGSPGLRKNAIRVDKDGYLYAPINNNKLTFDNLEKLGAYSSEYIATFYHIKQVSDILNKSISSLATTVQNDYIKKSSVKVTPNTTDGTVNIEIITT